VIPFQGDIYESVLHQYSWQAWSIGSSIGIKGGTYEKISIHPSTRSCFSSESIYPLALGHLTIDLLLNKHYENGFSILVVEPTYVRAYILLPFSQSSSSSLKSLELLQLQVTELYQKQAPVPKLLHELLPASNPTSRILNIRIRRNNSSRKISKEI
jgi:hypothetical protein